MTANQHVVAMEMPIVYTLDGDHDPDGLLFAPAAHRPLLEWVRARFEEDDGRLPRLHHRRQRAQLVVDALGRLDAMLERLLHGRREDQELLAELLRREHVAGYDEPEDRDTHGPRREGGRAGAVRLNVTTTLEELRVALADLGGSAGLASWQQDSDAASGDPAQAATSVRVVSRSREQREEWAAHWRTQVELLDSAIERWHLDVETDPTRRFDADALALASGMSPARVRHLMLNDHRTPVRSCGAAAAPYDRCNPMRPVPVVEPLTLRTTLGTSLEITVENAMSRRRLGFHVQGGGLTASAGPGVRHADGCRVGRNPDTTLAPGERVTLRHDAAYEGVWPVNDLADARGGEAGTNAHGLFGVLVVEPAGSTWRDPVTGEVLSGTAWDSRLVVDVLRDGEPTGTPEHAAYVDLCGDDVPRSYREFTVFIHDEPEIHSGLHTSGEHTVMPLSYRAEPMHNRLPHRMRRLAAATRPEPADDQVGVDRTAVSLRLGDELEEQFWTARTTGGDWLERVAGEEQHHSSWLFGEPVTPVLRAYAGDPARVRLVHAGVKETHVYHLHVHQWRAVPQDTAAPSVWGVDAEGRPVPKGSQLLDSVTIGPQTATTIDPLYGSGSRQHAVGDIIWHCHLYPHFHHGMWGLWRSFDRLVDGSRAYPDGTPCPALLPLPGREPPAPDATHPGFPWFVDGEWPMKSPPPPAARPEHRVGRRLLLGMGAASELEVAAMAPGCRDGQQPGALFVDLARLAEQANHDAGLPPPRVLSYDVEVMSSRVDYNVDGWHDPRGHHYRLLAVEVRERDVDGTERVIHRETMPALPQGNPEPFYPRANHGDIVELRLHNALQSFPADGFDVGQAPVECGLHVHLVKFDPLAADGSATGWNYLSGASCREAVGTDHPGEARTVSLHRWVVDEEFGPCFFHDHLLANFRQKHGLYAALIAEPHGSQWHDPHEQDRTAWASPQAVVLSPATTGVTPFREACLGIGDFVPLLDRGGRALNPPSTLSGDDDPGAMGVNYRNAPLTFRGSDPSRWFASSTRSQVSMHGTAGDPDTPLIELYPSERLRLRLIQGSHEEQHSFVAHGLRWRREWGNPGSPLVNQQSLGISEAFTLDVDPRAGSPFGPGDHLWMCAAMDDLWVGCWGLVRVLRPTPSTLARLAPLADLDGTPSAAVERRRTTRATPGRPSERPGGGYAADVRTYVVVARRTEHRYAGPHLTDPWGLRWHAAAYDRQEERQARETGIWRPERVRDGDGPLVLRARRGEWVRVIVVNEVLGGREREWAREDGSALPRFGVEPSPPRLPLEHLDRLGRPDRRTVSPRVSLHASLVSCDVVADDGAWVGHNQDGTVAPVRADDDEHGGHAAPGRVVHRDHDEHDHDERNWTEQWWYADPWLAPASHADGPGTVCLLSDMGDIRNHRHHGLVGALVVEPGDVEPFRHGSTGVHPDGWTGTDVELRDMQGELVAQESVVFVQDGLRLFIAGHPDLPAPDVVPLDDPEDSGHKALSYRSAVLHRGVSASGPGSGAPSWRCAPGTPLWVRVVGAGDKPRMQTVTMHGMRWPRAPWVPGGPWVGSLSGVAPGWAETCITRPEHPGDHCVRTGVFRWGTELGAWGVLRVE